MNCGQAVRRVWWLALLGMCCVPAGWADSDPSPQPPQPVVPSLSVPLQIVNPPTVPYPAVSGIPLPQGVLKSVSELALACNGVSQRAQFDPLVLWPDGSVKSVQVATIIQPGTAACVLTNSADGPAVVAPAQPAALEPATLTLVNAADGKTSTGHLTYAVEEHGAVRTVTKGVGKFVSPDKTEWVDLQVRIYAYHDLPFRILEPTIIDRRPEEDSAAKRQGRAFEATSYTLTLPVNLSGLSYRFGGDQQIYDGLITGEHSIYETGSFKYHDGRVAFTFGYEGVGTGQRADGWVSTPKLGVAVRYFWQQFPKALTVTPEAIRVELHPQRASDVPRDTTPGAYDRPHTFYFAREGGAKTYQILVRTDPADMAALNAAFQDPPRLVASPDWYASTGVFGHLIPAGPLTAGYDQWLFSGIYRPVIKPWEGTLGHPLGWRDFGDRMRGGHENGPQGQQIPYFYNDTHVGANKELIQYLRTLEPLYWYVGEIATLHFRDIDVSHTDRGPRHYGPGEPHLLGHDIIDHECRNMHDGHAHLSALPIHYLLTGDKRDRDVLDEMGNWLVRFSKKRYPPKVDSKHLAEAERDFGWPLYCLNELYKVTGDRRYLEAGAGIARHLIAWWQVPSDHIVKGEVVGRNDWTQGTGWWFMYPREGNSDAEKPCNGTNPWMAGALIGNIIVFLQMDEEPLVDHQLADQMLFQTMNYVVKYGYNREKGYFAYTECRQAENGGDTHIVLPLAYLAQRLSSAPHPEQYDTADQWLAIAQHRFNKLQTPKTSTSPTGWYGYEQLFPWDLWSVVVDADKIPAE